MEGTTRKHHKQPDTFDVPSNDPGLAWAAAEPPNNGALEWWLVVDGGWTGLDTLMYVGWSL